MENNIAIEQISQDEQKIIVQRLTNRPRPKENKVDNDLYYAAREKVSEDLHQEISEGTIKFSQDVLKSWSKKEFWEIGLRAAVLGFLGYLLNKQVDFINQLILGVAEKGWEFNEVTLNLFISVVFVEITALITIALRYLFKERTTSVLDIAKDMINNASLNNMKYNRQHHNQKNSKR